MTLTRRSFLALVSGVLVPVPEPVRSYSFVGGWNVDWLDDVKPYSKIAVDRYVRGTNVMVRLDRGANGLVFETMRDGIIDHALSEAVLLAMLGQPIGVQGARIFCEVVRRLA